MADFIGTRLNSTNARHKKVIDFLDQKVKEGSFNKSEFLISALEEKIDKILNPATTPAPAPAFEPSPAPAPIPVPVAAPSEPNATPVQSESAGKQVFDMFKEGW